MRGVRKLAVLFVVVLLATVLLSTSASAMAIPKSLKAIAATTTTLKLDWRSVSKAPQYRVQYSTSPRLSRPTSVRFSKSAGTIKGLKPDTKYWFRVRVISKSGSKNLSKYPKAPYSSARTLAVATPTGFAVTSRVSNAVGLAWVASEGAVKYDLQRSTTAAMTTSVTTSTATNDLTVKPLTAQADYWFRVRAVTAAGVRSAYSVPIKATTTAFGAPDPQAKSADVRVANFNIFGIDADHKAKGNQKVWATRKPEVAKDIVNNQADVVGLQEANQSSVYYPKNSGLTQYLDLLKAVNGRGARYALTNNKNYNCERYISSEKCVFRDQSASRGVRILYNTQTLALQQQGSFKYKHQTGSVERYLVWATFRVKANGRVFLFVTTHLQPFDGAAQTTTRVKQWRELISWVRNKRDALDNLRLVVAGDFNTTRNTSYAEDLLPAMKSAGFGDVLNQEFKVNPIVSPRAEQSVNGWINSRNGWSKDLKGNTDVGSPWTFYGDRNKAQASQQTGNNIDWIFATNELRVKEWRVVVEFSPSSLKVSRIIPSDHNMVRATLVLPPPT